MEKLSVFAAWTALVMRTLLGGMVYPFDGKSGLGYLFFHFHLQSLAYMAFGLRRHESQRLHVFFFFDR